ncbi:AzlD domain-containing protein [Pseudomonas sp. PD9R]|uniref:AzlD domain-containing protein n=1 Tax=Pseudomonas sp. PD9R TaxID=2853534 RepID=UPI001C47D735|nr:AzlD domain-containing protein [Pseudomonas sp. PD9R]MBV6824197.1 AzlD domain-containing protein [Pseudomonas sp. PD9R]
MSNWGLILVAASVSYCLRFLPVLIFRKYKINGDGNVYVFLSYAACAVMGGIIYSIAFGDALFLDWSGHFEDVQLMKLIVILLSFFVAAFTRSVIKSLVCCASIYGVALYLL